MIAVAVDAGGADLGPREVAAGAALAAARASRVLLFGPAAEIGRLRTGWSGRRADLDRQGRRSRARGPLDPRRLDRPGRARPSPRAAPQALVSGGSTGSALAAGLFNMRRDRGIYRPALALPVPIPGARRCCCSTSAPTPSCRPEHLVQFAHMGSAFAQAVMGIAAPARGAAVQRRGADARARRTCSSVHEQLAGRRRRRPQLHRQHRGHAGRRRASPTSSSWTASPATSR